VSAYNIFYLDEFFTWCGKIGLPKPWLGLVHAPTHMKPTVWPAQARDQIVKHLSSSHQLDVRTWAQAVANSDNSDKFDEFCTRLHQHDQYRGLDFTMTFPEMAVYINDR
jgi:hypothetical protein